MRKKPPYYKEAHALVSMLTDARYYVEATEFPMIAYTDQQPLAYIKTCAKGPVLGWCIENLMGMRYEVRYLPGEVNIEADALSRYPMLGPRVLTRVGLDHAVDCLLDNLPDDLRGDDAGNMWVWAGRDTDAVVARVADWRKSKRKIYDRGTSESIRHAGWRWAIIVPRPDQATE